MSDAIEQLNQWIDQIAKALTENTHFEISHFSFLEHDIGLIEALIGRIENQPLEMEQEQEDQFYSACLFAFDICIIQLQAAIENQYQPAEISLNKIMALLANQLRQTQHPINFWLPLLNAFYEVHIELSDELKDAYVSLASQEEADFNDVDQIQLIRDMIKDLSDLSVFDITQHFFAQSHAMPADFYYDLLYDLFSIDEGHDIAILCLMHPKAAVRDVVIDTINQIIDKIALTPDSLRRLNVMKHWHPATLEPIFEHWIKIQRRQGVTYPQQKVNPKHLKIIASEIDGHGTQVISLHFHDHAHHHTCNMILQVDGGIKDIWFSSTAVESDREENDMVAEEDIVTRTVDIDYLQLMLQHFLATTIQSGHFPDIRLLQLQESLALQLLPHRLDPQTILDEIGVSIQPVTQDVIEASLQSSKKWPQTKAFTQAWYVQDAEIDAEVNKCCRFEQGVKICDRILAREAVIDGVFESRRQRWLFHFIWHMLWLAANAKKMNAPGRIVFLLLMKLLKGAP